MLGADLCWPCLVAVASDWGGVLVLLVVVVWVSVRERLWISTHLADEVQAGTLSQEDYAVVRSYVGRVAARLSALFGGDLRRWWDLGRFYRLATELAFNKQRLTHFPGEEDTRARVEQLRGQVRAMTNETTGANDQNVKRKT